MNHRAQHPPVRSIVAPLFAVLAISAGGACSGDGAPVGTDTSDDPRRIQILLRGQPVDSVLRVGAFGPIAFSLAEEDADGRLTPVTGRRIAWGSTLPSVAEAAAGADNGYAVVRRNGRARIIAELDGRRDTVTLEVAQVAVAARFVSDTLVALTPDAVDVGGGTASLGALPFAVIRVDSNGYEAPSTTEIHYLPPSDGAFEVVVDGAGGESARILGLRPGQGQLVLAHGAFADTVLVQVTDAFRVVRLVETPSGALRVFPDTARISPGVAVIFQNEASFTTSIASQSSAAPSWRAGPIPANGREAQLFTAPAVHTYGWGGPRAIIVTP